MADGNARKVRHSPDTLKKCPSGIRGFDDVTGGGLPKGRPTLVAGAAGSGKTLLALEFLVRGAREYNEPGVFMAFEERADDLTRNASSLGFDLAGLVAAKKLIVDHVRIERSEIQETGEYDLEGLFIRLGNSIDSVGAKRVVLDTLESLFSSLPNELILRAELRRLFSWLKEKGVTAIITAERGEETVTRYGLEEYVADCVILLDNRVSDQISTRRLRIMKYRGSSHGTNEYPFLVAKTGIFLAPITAMRLDYAVRAGRISSGIERLDAMLGRKGFYRGSSILLTGTPGTGKTSFAAQFAHAACARGEKVLYLAYEESREQIYRNMRSIGLDFSRWDRKGLMTVHASRPTGLGIEAHLLTMHRMMDEVKPAVVVIDPVSNFSAAGSVTETIAMLARLIDYFKASGTTTLFTSLITKGATEDATALGISSLMDTWIQLKDIETSGEHNRGLFILKSRGMAHSNQTREFLLTDRGIKILDVSVSAGVPLMGTARAIREESERAEAVTRSEEVQTRRRWVAQKRKEALARIASIEAELNAAEDELDKFLSAEELRAKARSLARQEIGKMRMVDVSPRNRIAGRNGRRRGNRQ